MITKAKKNTKKSPAIKTSEEVSKLKTKEEKIQYLKNKMQELETLQATKTKKRKTYKTSTPNNLINQPKHIIYHKGKIYQKRGNELRLIYYVSRRKEAGLIKEIILKWCRHCEDNDEILKVNIERAGRQLQIKAHTATLEEMQKIHYRISKEITGKIAFKFNLVSVLYNEMANWTLQADERTQ
jgi:hypothetical protein